MGFSACHWLKKDQRCNSSLLLVLLLLFLPSLRLRLMLMLLFSMELMDMVDMLVMLEPMVLTLTLEYMVAVTLARGLLMLSPRLMLMATMVPMDTLDMVLPLMPTLDTVDILDTVHMLVTHTLMEPPLPTVLIPIWDKKETSIPC